MWAVFWFFIEIFIICSIYRNLFLNQFIYMCDKYILTQLVLSLLKHSYGTNEEVDK